MKYDRQGLKKLTRAMERHGVRPARSHFFRYHGKLYDMKAVVRLAFKAVDRPIGHSHRVARRMDQLGLDVVVV